MKYGVEGKFDQEGQGQSIPQNRDTNQIALYLLYEFGGSSLYSGKEFSRGQALSWHAETDTGNIRRPKGWPRVKTNQSVPFKFV